MISQDKHATARFHPFLERPQMMFLFLDILAQQRFNTVVLPLLSSFPRPHPQFLKGQFCWDSIKSLQYKHVNSNLNIVKELIFRIQTEKGEGYKELKNVRVTLHFVYR